MTTVLVRSRAHEDIAEATDWYLEIGQEYAQSLVLEYETMLARVEAYPRMFPETHRNVRLAPLKRFPYNVWYVYQSESDVATVLRVTHKRRDDEPILDHLPDPS